MEKTLDQAKDEISRLEMTLQQEKTKSSKLQQKVMYLHVNHRILCNLTF